MSGQYIVIIDNSQLGGSAYCYVYTALGELPAFLIGWSLLFEYHLAVTLSAKTLIQYMDSVSNGTVRSAFTLSLTYNSNDSIFLDVPSALLVLTLGFVLNRNLKSSCLYNNIFVFICLLVIGGIVLSSAYEADAENWTSGPGFFPNGIVGLNLIAPTPTTVSLWYAVHAFAANLLHLVRYSSDRVFVYMSFGVWNGLQASQSLEALEGSQTHDSQNINELILIETSDDGLELNACDQIEVIGSSV
ncbi:unnamed protein product [Oppiella nova]|uniref:Uncharacterized protein n=1 Tax=Oppiella nova TaxID=334625 RepID=A0A7R9M3A6_9ACAR|nr:unnamed protein product [Oppiella nova]CAG2169850.1 unnamed protein product [Oppiella nova]